MSSILTNTSAMVALQTMKGINANLNKTQADISTGKSVASAKDNAAVWAISKVMESDVEGFKGISDSLSVGSATLTVARNASETVTKLLTEMKGKIVASQAENVDRTKIQTDIDALTKQIESTVGAAQFNGLNLVNGSQTTVNVLSSLDRSQTGVTSWAGACLLEISHAAHNAPTASNRVCIDNFIAFGWTMLRALEQAGGEKVGETPPPEGVSVGPEQRVSRELPELRSKLALFRNGRGAESSRRRTDERIIRRIKRIDIHPCDKQFLRKDEILLSNQKQFCQKLIDLRLINTGIAESTGWGIPPDF